MSETNGTTTGGSTTPTTPTYQADSVINQVVEAVIGLMNATTPFATVARGALPTGIGITCEVGPSTPSEVYLDKNSYVPLDVTLNGKHPNLKTLSDTLNGIHSALTRARTYPESDSWQIVDITTYTLPQIVDREDNNEWLMASSLSVKFYWRGD